MSELPLISVIMPTRNRRVFVPQAIRLFQSQDYPNKELLVIDDGEDYVRDIIPACPEIRYIAISTPLSIGMKRNIACSLAHGEIIVHADDDDYFGPQRLSKQVQPLLDGKADLTALKMSLLLRTHDSTLWACSDRVHEQLFSHNVRCGTLMYRAYFWHEGLCYENKSTGEDADFLHMLIAQHVRLERITDPASYICVRHGDNVTADIEGMDMLGWEQVPMERYLSGEEVAFYAGLREGVARV